MICCRHDLLQIAYGSDNETLVVRTTGVGHTVLKVCKVVCFHIYVLFL